MTLLKISLTAIKRQLGKRLVLLTALTLGLTTVLSLIILMESQEHSIEKQFDEYGANIIVMPKQDNLSLSYGGINISSVVTHSETLSLADAEEIYRIPNDKNIRAVSPKLVGAITVHAEAGSENALLVGVDMNEEKKIKSWWNIDGTFPETESGIIAGWDAALQLGLHVNDSLEIMNQTYVISGILKPTGSQDDTVFLAHMNTAESILGRSNQVSLIDVSALCSDCPIDELVSQIKTALPHADVKAIRQVMNQRMELVARFNQFAVTLAVIVTLLCAFLTFSIMTGSIVERKHEIGIFRAIGFSRKNILSIIQSETIIVSGIAGLLAIILTLLSSYILLPHISDIQLQDINPSPLLFITGLTAVILLSLLASLAPAVKAANIDPVETISSI